MKLRNIKAFTKILKVLGMILIVLLLCVALVGCTEALELEITSPTDGDLLQANHVTVEGKVSDLEATVTINGEEVPVRLKMQYPAFSGDVELSEGENTITVIATLNGQEVSETITVRQGWFGELAH